MPDDPAALPLPPALSDLVDLARRAEASPEMARRALAILDLTSLNDGDDEARIEALCRRASTPAGPVAGVCLYSRFVAQARRLLEGSGIRVVTVANFPAGGSDAAAAAAEVRSAVADGADEVDVVFPYAAFLAGDAASARGVVAAAREACGPARLKVILETGRLGSAGLIAEASALAVEEGADFLKTSTGKVEPGATLEAAAIMLETAREAREAGRAVGFKAAGGVRTAAEAAPYLAMADRVLGRDWVAPVAMRIGASSLLDDLLRLLGHQPAATPPSSGY